jgi:hypothetical protein
VSAEQELSLAVEQYKQVASDVKSPTSGSLAGQKMQPDLNAFIAQVGYRFAWK